MQPLLAITGILTRASEAKEKTQKASEDELRTLTMLEATTNLENQLYTDKNGDTATIPTGFAVSQIDGENTISDGLVIIDSRGNEFVWVPVNSETDFISVDGYSSGLQQQFLPSVGEADSTGTNSKYTETTLTQVEAKKMYASIKEYKGFFIGRYEAGKNNDGSVGVKKELYAYRSTPWSANGEMHETEGTTIGAIELARNFDTMNSYSSVTSTLIYGVQWDATIKWMENIPNPNIEGKTYIQDSRGMGWYSDNYLDGNSEHKTGIDLDGGKNKVKNIYDLAGNVREWTMESYFDTGRFTRGGDYYYTGFSCPASVRQGNIPPSTSNGEFGFRLTLYINI